MNDHEVYGDIICRVSAPELVDGGYILPPKVKVIEMDKVDRQSITPFLESNNVLTTIDEVGTKKVLVCAKTTKQLITFFQTDFAQQLEKRGYSYLYITAKTGAVIDGVKVSREEFFNTLNAWGKDIDKKFVVLHRSILSEGINVSQLDCVIFMRNMDVIELTQTVGRVLRLAPAAEKTAVSVLYLPTLRLVSALLKHCRRLLTLCSSRVNSMTPLFAAEQGSDSKGFGDVSN